MPVGQPSLSVAVKAGSILAGHRQKLMSFNSQSFSEVGNNIDCSAINAPLQRADIRAIKVREMRKLLLRQTPRLPPNLQVLREYLSNLHVRESSVL